MISPVAVSTVSDDPNRRIGCAQLPTRATASDQASKSRDTNRLRTCRAVWADIAGRSRPAVSLKPAKESGT